MANLYKCGSIGLTGDAIAANVLYGKTFYASDPLTKLTGSMTDRSGWTRTLTTSTTSRTIPAGYHDGTGTVSITTQTKTVTPSTAAVTVSPDSGQVLSSVTVSAIPIVEKTASKSVTVAANSSSTETFSFSGISQIFGITQIAKASGGSQYLSLTGAYPSTISIPSSIGTTTVKLVIVNNSDASATATFSVKVKGV